MLGICFFIPDAECPEDPNQQGVSGVDYSLCYNQSYSLPFEGTVPRSTLAMLGPIRNSSTLYEVLKYS